MVILSFLSEGRSVLVEERARENGEVGRRWCVPLFRPEKGGLPRRKGREKIAERR